MAKPGIRVVRPTFAPRFDSAVCECANIFSREVLDLAFAFRTHGCEFQIHAASTPFDLKLLDQTSRLKVAGAADRRRSAKRGRHLAGQIKLARGGAVPPAIDESLQ
jgi:hypothetical protein